MLSYLPYVQHCMLFNDSHVVNMENDPFHCLSNLEGQERLLEVVTHTQGQ